jgi:hypothetical protein
VPPWLRPKSTSLEEFVLWILRVLFLVALAVYACRYALTADMREAPWTLLLRGL